MTQAAGRLSSSTTGLIRVVLAIVVVIGLAGPAGATAHYRPAGTQFHISDGAIRPPATIYDSARFSWSGASEASLRAYDSDVGTRADAAGVGEFHRSVHGPGHDDRCC